MNKTVLILLFINRATLRTDIPRMALTLLVTRNVTVRYNIFRIGMGISIGTESSESISDVHIQTVQ